MKLRNIYDRLAIGMIAVASLFTAAVYEWLPDPMPTHFNAHGVADGFMSRPYGASFGIVTSVLVWAVVRFGGLALSREWRRRLDASPMAFVGFLVVALMTTIQGIILYASLATPPNVATSFALALGGFWILLGLVMPRVRRNPFVGIRTAWTLTNDENWARTHRLGGVLFVAAGFIAMLGGLLGSLALAIAAILTSAIVPAAYSFVLSRRLDA
jgi:uncharacterized membrane protein